MILVFDIGTTAVKGAVFSMTGRLLHKESAPVQHIPSKNSHVHETDPEEWIRIITELNQKLFQSTSLTAAVGKVQAIVVSGNGPTMIPVDKHGKALSSAMTWLDRRGIEESGIIKKLSGISIDPSFYLPKALWVKRHASELYEKTAFFLSCSEYVVMNLTGEAAMVFPGEGLENFIWTDELLDITGLDKNKFPPFVEPGSQLGTVTSTAANSICLGRGIPVYAGGPDFIVSLLGTAAVKPGRACDRAGTSEGINICSRVKIDDTRLMCYRHVIREFWNVTGIISTSGKALEWFRDNIYQKKLDYEAIDERASMIPAGAGKLLFLPYLTGERAPLWDPNARGIFIGLSLHHTIDDMARAVLESTGFAIRDILTVMEERGILIDELRITGTPAKSDVWNQIKADITGKRILVPEITDSELVGDVCLALYGMGEYSSLEEVSEQMVRISQVFEPGINSSIYNDLFGVYRETYRTLKPLFAELAAIQEKG